MSGFDFVLLAMRGRLAEGDLPAEERAKLEGFLADYLRISEAFRARRAAPPAAAIGAPRPFTVGIASVPSN